jgi:hypothetical protein
MKKRDLSYKREKKRKKDSKALVIIKLLSERQQQDKDSHVNLANETGRALLHLGEYSLNN